ncbi:hypothetical protein B5S32_g320 [[Candida] boidinii]|uniref:Unnamed protein product n=1 Tax=Candida boidinii TaxID=5477 RepID=A0ACB5TQJ8_CANBO|nr:hypothetical protein B5S32_g320 [[Candida] boidinii]GME92799.1 unnamed protein product [[Candida] boidinii]
MDFRHPYVIPSLEELVRGCYIHNLQNINSSIVEKPTTPEKEDLFDFNLQSTLNNYSFDKSNSNQSAAYGGTTFNYGNHDDLDEDKELEKLSHNTRNLQDVVNIICSPQNFKKYVMESHCMENLSFLIDIHEYELLWNSVFSNSNIRRSSCLTCKKRHERRSSKMSDLNNNTFSDRLPKIDSQKLDIPKINFSIDDNYNSNNNNNNNNTSNNNNRADKNTLIVNKNIPTEIDVNQLSFDLQSIRSSASFVNLNSQSNSNTACRSSFVNDFSVPSSDCDCTDDTCTFGASHSHADTNNNKSPLRNIQKLQQEQYYEDYEDNDAVKEKLVSTWRYIIDNYIVDNARDQLNLPSAVTRDIEKCNAHPSSDFHNPQNLVKSKNYILSLLRQNVFLSFIRDAEEKIEKIRKLRYDEELKAINEQPSLLGQQISTRNKIESPVNIDIDPHSIPTKGPCNVENPQNVLPPKGPCGVINPELSSPRDTHHIRHTPRHNHTSSSSSGSSTSSIKRALFLPLHSRFTKHSKAPAPTSPPNNFKQFPDSRTVSPIASSNHDNLSRLESHESVSDKRSITSDLSDTSESTTRLSKMSLDEFPDTNFTHISNVKTSSSTTSATSASTSANSHQPILTRILSKKEKDKPQSTHRHHYGFFSNSIFNIDNSAN